MWWGLTSKTVLFNHRQEFLWGRGSSKCLLSFESILPPQSNCACFEHHLLEKPVMQLRIEEKQVSDKPKRQIWLRKYEEESPLRNSCLHFSLGQL